LNTKWMMGRKDHGCASVQETQEEAVERQSHDVKLSSFWSGTIPNFCFRLMLTPKEDVHSSRLRPCLKRVGKPTTSHPGLC
jgi:predicted P-loop ATPase